MRGILHNKPGFSLEIPVPRLLRMETSSVCLHQSPGERVAHADDHSRARCSILPWPVLEVKGLSLGTSRSPIRRAVLFPSILSLTSARVAITSGTHCALCVLANRLLFFFFFWSFWPYIFLLQCLRIHCFFQLKQLPSLSDVSPWTRLTCPLSDLSYTVNALHTDLPVANFQRCQCAFHQHQV